MRFGEDSFGGSTGSTSGSISLRKGQKISLSKGGKHITKARVGLGWSCPERVNGYEVDLDATAILCHDNGMAVDIHDFVFYGNEVAYDGAVSSSGDSRRGGDGSNDDETLYVDFSKVPSFIKSIAINVSVYEYRKRRQNFGQVNSAYVRVIDEETGHEEIRYDLGNDFNTETGLIVCKFIRDAGGWTIEATGQGVEGGLAGVGKTFGLDLDDEN